jgi:hypothetical protein
LVKAALVQSATDIAGQYAAPYNEAGAIPNANEGWGAVNVAAAAVAGQRYVDEERDLLTGDVAGYSFASAGGGAARFTLVWTDYPAAVEAGVQLVNDLDLEVVTPGGSSPIAANVFAGRIFGHRGQPTDRRNNVECVYLPAARRGPMPVRVRGLQRAPGAAALRPARGPGAGRLHLPGAGCLGAARYWGPLVAASSVTSSAPKDGTWPVDAGRITQPPTSNGQYRLRVSPTRDALAAFPGRVQSGDLLLEVTAHAGSDAAQAYGLAFNRKEATPTPTYIAFLVSPSGAYAIARQDGTLITDGWVTSSAVWPGRADNRLRIERVGQRVTFSINGVAVRTLTRAEFVGGDRFGLVTWCTGSSEWSEAWFAAFRMVPLSSGTSASAESARVGEAAAPLLDIGAGVESAPPPGD